MLTTDKFISRRSVLIGTMLLTSIIVTGEVYSASVSADEQAERELAAKQVTQQFVKQLGGHLKKEM